MGMDIKPIEIDIDDNKAFAQVAFLVDRTDFLKDIQEIRSKFQLTSLFDEDSEELQGHFIKLSGFTIKDFNEKYEVLTLLNTFDTLLKDNKNEEADKLLKTAKDARLAENKFEVALKVIRQKYGYPEMFDSVVKQAVLKNKVDDFSTAYATSFDRPGHDSDEDNPDLFVPHDTVMAIVVTPYSSIPDIKKAFKECKTYVREIVELKTNAQIYKKVSQDTFTNIKRDRIWHWEQKNGKKYRELADKWNEKLNMHERADAHPENKRVRCEFCLIDDPNYIGQAVAEYRQYITS